MTGPVNLTAPAPVTNAVFTAALARAVHRPALLAVPAVALRAGLGEASGELLGSARVLPREAGAGRLQLPLPGHRRGAGRRAELTDTELTDTELAELAAERDQVRWSS